MKTHIITATLAITILPAAVFAQQRTYFDMNWEVTTSKEKIQYYRETTKKGNLYHIKDFYKNGSIQMDGFSHNNIPNEEIWEGKVVWYLEDGSIDQYSSYKNGKLDGESYSDNPNGGYSRSNYKDGELVNRESLVHNIGNSFLYEKVEDKITTQIVYQTDIKGIRYEQIREGDNFITKYYGEGGKYIGQSTEDKNGVNGTIVNYTWEPMKVHEILYQKNDDLISKQVFYSTGKLKNEYKKTGKTGVETSYDKSGKLIAKLDYKNLSNESEDIEPYSGVKMDFDNDNIYCKDYFENGKIYKTELFKDGVLWQITENVIIDDVVLPKKLITYNPDGSERFVLTYKEGLEYDGTEIYGSFQRDYKKGEMTYERRWYNDGKTHYIKHLTGKDQLKGTTYLPDGEKYNDFTIKLSDTGYFTGVVKFYKNGNSGKALEIVDGVLKRGKLRYYSYYIGELVEIESDGKNYFYRDITEGEISREIRVPLKYISSDLTLFDEQDLYSTELYNAGVEESGESVEAAPY